ncbi:MAG: ABC-2 transporter permease [Anaerolineaceae bacterium]|nr:ABC-2 transporter permease [Anaerolineaceae bacterium]
MKNLLYKEFKLSVHTTCYIFLLTAAMLLIPNYPYYVAFFYQTLGIFFIFLSGNATNDIFFTTLLPIRKKDAVKARFETVILLELLQIIVAVPFIILRNMILPAENLAGMEANIALIGLVFIMFGIFNSVFLPMFYKSAYQTGIPYLISCAAMAIFLVIAEVVIQLNPAWKEALDTTNMAYFPQQFVVFLVGILVFALFTAIAYAKSAKEFEKLDL